MAGRDLPCYGVCGGDPKWRSPEGFPCALCGATGIVKAPLTQAEEGAQAWQLFQRRTAKFLSKSARRKLRSLLPKPRKKRARVQAAPAVRRGLASELERKAWFASKGPSEAERAELAKMLERTKEELCQRTNLNRPPSSPSSSR